MKKISSDTSKLSKESRRSYSAGIPYEDHVFNCRHCGSSATYTAREQQYDYEQRKLYIHSKPFLCPRCYREKRILERKIGEYEERWKSDKKKRMADRGFITNWIFLLERTPTYGIRKNHAQVAMLRKIQKKLGAVSA